MKLRRNIKRLIDALTDTGLVVAVSSFGGHFGEKEHGGHNDREKALVRFVLIGGVPENELEKLFGYLINTHAHTRLMWKALLNIFKEYIPSGYETEYVSDHVYMFEIRPFEPDDSAENKRRYVDWVIDQTSDNIAEFMASTVNVAQ